MVPHRSLQMMALESVLIQDLIANPLQWSVRPNGCLVRANPNQIHGSNSYHLSRTVLIPWDPTLGANAQPNPMHRTTGAPMAPPPRNANVHTILIDTSQPQFAGCSWNQRNRNRMQDRSPHHFATRQAQLNQVAYHYTSWTGLDIS